MRKVNTVITRTAEDLARALDLPPQEAVQFELRRQLQKKISEVVRHSGMTHAEVAKAAATSRTRLTALLNGNTLHISTDLMLRLLSALGYSAKLTFRRSAA